MIKNFNFQYISWFPYFNLVANFVDFCYKTSYQKDPKLQNSDILAILHLWLFWIIEDFLSHKMKEINQYKSISNLIICQIALEIFFFRYPLTINLPNIYRSLTFLARHDESLKKDFLEYIIYLILEIYSTTISHKYL